jgi:hypothetical protein
MSRKSNYDRNQEFLSIEHNNLKKNLMISSKRMRSVQFEEGQNSELYGPHYILDIELFMKEHMKSLEENLKNVAFATDIRYAFYQEYKVLELIVNINRANQNKLVQNKNSPSSSQLIIANNIIKDSSEMTSYIYLLNWLQNIFSMELELSDIEPLKKQTLIESAQILKNQSSKNFHFDMLGTNENLNKEV